MSAKTGQAAPLREYRQLLTLLAPVESKGANGEIRLDYMQAAIVYGKMEPIASRETFVSQGVRPTTTHIASMRIFKKLKSSWRIQCKSRMFEVDGVTETMERNRETVATCVEITA